LVGGIVSVVNVQTTATDADDLDKFAAAAKTYVTDILDQSNTQLENTLLAFFGKGDMSDIDTLYDRLVVSGIVDESSRISSISKV
jgi:hypothetical protein